MSTSGADVNDKALFTITEESYEKFSFLSNTCLTPLICALGLTGNCMGFGVLRHEQRKLPVYVYMCALTFFDGAYLLVGLIRSIPRFLELSDKYLANAIETHEQLGSIYLDMVLAHTSTAMILVMSMERLLALVRPFTVKDMLISKYPLRVIALCLCVNLIFLLPYPICFEVQSYMGEENRTEYYLQFKPETQEFMDRYMVVQTTVDYYFPGVAILLINVAIPVAYSRTLREQSSTLQSAIGNQHTKITLTVLCITLMYFLLSLPNLFIKTLAFVEPGYSFDGKYQLAFWLFIDVSNLFAYLNAANDFVIYILVSKHYRKLFKTLYCSCLGDSETFDSLEDGQCSSVSRHVTVTERMSN